MDPEWPLAGRGIHNAHDPVSDLRRVGVGVGGRQLGESGVDPVDEAAVVVLVVRCALLVRGTARALEVVRPGGECARNDDRRLDAEANQFGRIAHGERVIPAFAAKYGARYGGVPPRVL